LDHADNLDENISNLDIFLDFWEILRVQSEKVGLKMNVKKTNLLKLGINEDKK